MLLAGITDHKRMKEAMSIKDGTIKSKNGNVHKRRRRQKDGSFNVNRKMAAKIECL